MRQGEQHASRHRGVAPAACGLALTVVLMALAGPAQARAQTAPLSFAGCRPSQVSSAAPGLQCATLPVPLDRGDPAAGSVTLAVQRVPARGTRVGAIVLLAGGPGQAAIPPFEELIAPLARRAQLRGFELVAFDQRGTGESGELRCTEPQFAPAGGEEEGFAGTCGNSLGPARADYTSQDSVEDLDALREALGGGPLSLLAVSYGGRVAGMYAHEHPEDLAHMVLDSPSSMTGDDPLDTQRLRALPRVLDEGICGAGACRSFTANEYADLARLVSRVRRKPLLPLIFGKGGHRMLAPVTEGGLLRLVAHLDLPGWFPKVVPAAISAALHGDAAPLARMTSQGFRAEEGPGVSEALYLATYCDENPMPWAPDSTPSGRLATAEAFLGSVPAASTAPFSVRGAAAIAPLGLCLSWPATPAAPPAPGGVSPAPTLILSGVDDLRTPLEQSLSIAAGYSHVQLLQIPATGHSTISTDVSECALRAALGFLTSGQAPAACPAPTSPTALPLPPASLDAVRSAKGLPAHAAGAAALTLDDLLGQPGAAGGGLRGGSWALRGTRLLLRRTVDVVGVSLTGTIRLSDASSGRIALAGHVHGTLHARGSIFKGLTLTGRIDGVLVRARVVGA